MKYKIKEISISEDESYSLISEMISEINKYELSELDKKREFFVFSEDGLIDIWFWVEFFSEYKYVDGGVETTSRTVKFDIEFCLNETGESVKVESPVSFDEEIEEYFRID